MKVNKVHCPECKGFGSSYGSNPMGNPATLPCDRCSSTGEVSLISLTDEEIKNARQT
jgi:hypothetical protein